MVWQSNQTRWKDLLPTGKASTLEERKKAARLAFKDGRATHAIAKSLRRHSGDKTITERMVVKWIEEGER